MREILPNEIDPYLKNLATSTPDYKKPIPCPFFAVLEEDIQVNDNPYFAGTYVCSKDPANSPDIDCKIGETPLTPRIRRTVGMVALGQCVKGEIRFEVKVIPDGRVRQTSPEVSRIY